MRLRVTRLFDVLDFVPKKEAEFLSEVELPWGTADIDYTDCRLVKQDLSGQENNPNKAPNYPYPQLVRIYEQIDEELETQVGRTAVTWDQDNIVEVSNEWIQFSTGTPVYQVPGTTPADAPFSAAILKEEIRTNDGTLQYIKRNYIASGILSDLQDIRFNGKVLVRTITTIGIIPPTPTGYTLVGPGVEHPDGRQVYVYKFASAAGAAGAGGVISQETVYNESPNQGTTGVTVKTIKQVTDPSVVVNPISSPGAGYQLISVEFADDTGFRMWTAVYAFGQGVVSTETEIRNKGMLIIYSITSINAAPSAPSPTIGGTVVLISTDVSNGMRTRDGTIIYRYQWAEGKGVISTETQGESDGAIVTTITQLDANAVTPTNPGGAFLISLTAQSESGYYLSRAVHKKPPATITFKKQVGFEWPGVASFTGSPPQFVMQPPSNRQLLADVNVSYSTSQITDVPFSVTAYATFYETYTPTATGIPVQSQRGLGGYLAGASSISGTSSNYNGVPCDSYVAVLLSSIPSSLPSGATVIHTDNDPYLVDTSGTVVYRCTKITYSF